jgi:hypothetical protein
VHLSVAKVANKPLAASIEKGFRVLWLRPRPENLLVVEDNGAVRGGQVVTLFLFIAFCVILRCLVSIEGFEFEARDLVDLNAEDTRRILRGWRRGDDEFILTSLVMLVRVCVHIRSM